MEEYWWILVLLIVIIFFCLLKKCIGGFYSFVLSLVIFCVSYKIIYNASRIELIPSSVLAIGVLLLLIENYIGTKDFRKGLLSFNKPTNKDLEDISAISLNGIGIQRFETLTPHLYYNFFVICGLPIFPTNCYMAIDTGPEYGSHKKRKQDFRVLSVEKMLWGEFFQIFLGPWSILIIIIGLVMFS